MCIRDRAIRRAQEKIEHNNFGIRKNLLEYDQVNNDQREIIYAERLRVLNGENMRDVIFKMITDRVESCVDTCISSELPKEEWDLNELNQLLTDIIPLEPVNAAAVSYTHLTRSSLFREDSIMQSSMRSIPY